MTPETILTVGAAVLVQTAILSGLVLLADRFLPRRMVRERHDLALATILAVPVLFIVPFLLPGEPAPLPLMEEAAGAITETVPLLAVEPATVTVPATPAATAPDYTGLLTALAFMGWGLGVAYFLIRLGMDMLGVRTMMARARPVSLPGMAAYSRNVRLMASPEADGPMLAGVFRPAILLPEDMVSETALAPVIEHELAHLARRDNLVEVAIRIISALFWWNLPLHALRPLVAREREKLCDAYAAEKAGGGIVMADALLGVAKRRVLTRTPALALPAVRQKEALAARLRLLTGEGVGRPRFMLTAALVPAVFVACAAAGPKLGPVTDMPATAAEVRQQDDEEDNLYFAARRGDTEQVMQLIAMGASPNEVFYGKGTPLIGAVRSGDHSILTRLLAMGANPNVVSPGDGSPLIAAASGSEHAMAQTLLEAGADPNLGVMNDGNPLIAAARQDDVPMINMLLEAGADIEGSVPGDGNALIAAVQSGHMKAVHFLLEKGADVDAFVMRDETPLISAAQYGHLEIAMMLVEYGANPSLTVPVPHQWDASRDGYRSPISEAERLGHKKLADYLRSVGAEHRPPSDPAQ